MSAHASPQCFATCTPLRPRPETRSATARPAPSSPRSVLPTPITRMCWARSAVNAIDIQLQEMRCTGDARVMITNRLLTKGGERFIGQVKIGGENHAQVVLDAALVLRCRRYNQGS